MKTSSRTNTANSEKRSFVYRISQDTISVLCCAALREGGAPLSFPIPSSTLCYTLYFPFPPSARLPIQGKSSRQRKNPRLTLYSVGGGKEFAEWARLMQMSNSLAVVARRPKPVLLIVWSGFCCHTKIQTPFFRSRKNPPMQKP